MQEDFELESAQEPQETPVKNTENKPGNSRLWTVLLVLVLLVGGYFRFMGMQWDDGTYLHPDERFLFMVQGAIEPVQSFGEYFNTQVSSLNPNNRGHTFFVYGTFPIILVRYLAEWLETAGYGRIHLIGRPMSALADLLVVVLVYFVGKRLYDRRVGVLAAAFSAFAVLQIQLSHFYTVDTFTNLFTLLAVYLAVHIATTKWSPLNRDERGQKLSDYAALVWNHPLTQPSILFGVALGLAVASKVSSAPVAIVLPAAGLIYLRSVPEREWTFEIGLGFAVMSVGAIVSFLVFRIFQPYAFAGPGFFNINLNQLWLDGLNTLRAQTSAGADVGFPPAVQWIGRPLWFSGYNLFRFGVGIPMAIVSITGFVWMGWQMMRGNWRHHALLWGWTLFYFAWQSFIWNRTMRYQLPVYPGLAVFAGWTLIQLWDYGKGRDWQDAPGRIQRFFAKNRKPIALVVGTIALLGTFLWAYAFTRIYTRPVTRVAASTWMFENLRGPITIPIDTGDNIRQHPLSVPYDFPITPDLPYNTSFRAVETGTVNEILLMHINEQEAVFGPAQLRLYLSSDPTGEPVLATGVLDIDFDRNEPGYAVMLDQSVAVQLDGIYYLRVELNSGNGAVSLAGTAIANESTWDDGLPLRMGGYDAYGGIYQGGLNFEMYWPDNEDKVNRFVNNLNHADAIAITSSRQWASLTRLPELYPLTITYYRELMGCPSNLTVEQCYNRAFMGTFSGRLGYELTAVFDSSPNLGPIILNDQAADEAFTVYDHPKVFIFTKTDTYNPEQVRQLFRAVVLPVPGTTVSVGQGEQLTNNTILPEDALARHQTGGTFTEIFNPNGLMNTFYPFTVLAWYAVLTVLGLSAWPILRLALPGLSDGGYPFARTLGLLLLSYFVWLAGSWGIAFSAVTISIVFVLLLVVGGSVAFWQRDALVTFWREKRTYLLTVEALALGLFVFFLLIRMGNPDLWHPWKGGEKPMDVAYFTAVLKSTTFPPYDPWFSGGYINYYYYGFVFVGVLAKWLGVIPAIAYNLILPTLFMMVGLGAFSLGWNLTHRRHPDPVPAADDAEMAAPASSVSGWLAVPREYLVGFVSVLGVLILGNFGTVRMIFQGWQRLVAPPGTVFTDVGFIQQWTWAFQGFFKALSGAALPYSLGDWYWLPSRAIPAPGEVEPITEFPFFTFLYADLHAHMVALPLTMLALAWAISVVLARGKWGSAVSALVSFFVGGLAVGVLRPTNTWDFPTYLAIGICAMAYTYLFQYKPSDGSLFELFPLKLLRVGLFVGGSVVFAGLAVVLFQPFVDWYVLGYADVQPWTGQTTPLSAYFIHWGLFLTLIVTWMVWETRDWLANTPATAIYRIRAQRDRLLLAGVGWLVLVAGLTFAGASISWLVMLLSVWTLILLFRPGISEAKRIVLFMLGTGLFLTLMVEVIVLSGDIGRMNTVFKFYLQVWVLFGLGAAASVGWLLDAFPHWSFRVRTIWQFVVGVMLFAVALYPLLAGMAKVRDRMTENAPITLDGLAYMPLATYGDNGVTMTLDEDYDAILWMQQNVAGSPVLVEANTVEYRWGSRYSINTGLPSVIGWNWHQRQQRAFAVPGQVEQRVVENDLFYRDTEPQPLQQFLGKYDVSYIVVGQLERAYYAGPGIDKFEIYDGLLWREVFRSGQTVIYEVLESGL